MTKILVIDNAHLYKTSEGSYYTPSIYSYDFFKRYLQVFDEVRFVAKTKHVDHLNTDDFLRVDGKNLEIYELPWYQGLKGMFIVLPKLLKRYKSINKGCDCSILRVAQIESFLAYLFSDLRKSPFSLEVVNDPSTFVEVNAFFKEASNFFLKYIVKKANGVSYVTREYLQSVYPCRAINKGESIDYFQSYYSSIQLSENDIRTQKIYPKKLNKIKLIHVSNSINSNIKGHITVIDIANILVSKGYKVKVTFVGDGSLLKELKSTVKNMGLEDIIDFCGRIKDKTTLFNKLAEHDMFVFPTYSEGLPRCLIEAMAVGLPCLTTPVSGIPELIDRKYLFDPKDSDSFANEIVRLMKNGEELNNMSNSNLAVAKQYIDEVLQDRRRDFYVKLKELTIKKLQ